MLQRLACSPRWLVGSIDGWHQDAERRCEFAVQMGGDAVGIVQRRRYESISYDRVGLTRLAESGCQAVVAQQPDVAAVAQLEPGLQDRLHPQKEGLRG